MNIIKSKNYKDHNLVVYTDKSGIYTFVIMSGTIVVSKTYLHDLPSDEEMINITENYLHGVINND